MQLTYNQELHRIYLDSPLWKEIRGKALAHHGTVCNRCGEYGTDVHHKTYERWGGNERMEDFEVLCRPCHEAHHRIERSSGAKQSKKKKKKTARVEALARYLTDSQKEKIVKECGLSGHAELFIHISTHTKPIAARQMAMKMAGLDEVWWPKTKRRKSSIVHRNGRIEILSPTHPRGKDILDNQSSKTNTTTP